MEGKKKGWNEGRREEIMKGGEEKMVEEKEEGGRMEG